MVDAVAPVPWPLASLPFFAEHTSWQEATDANIIDFQVEVGVAKRRRRSYIPSTQVRFSRLITSEQLAAFLEFFEGDLRSGVYNFTAIDPRTRVTTEYQFAQVPTWSDVTTNDETSWWRLQFALRRVNLPPAPTSLAP